MKPNDLIANLKKLSLVKKVGPRPKVGLDIEPTSIALVEFSGGFGQLQLKAASLLGISKNILTNEEVKDKNALTEAISKIKLLSHCRTKTISINAPGTLVVTKEVTVPTNLEENDWENHARNEAKKLFPGLENNLFMDFTVYETKKGDKTVNNMLLIAARKKEMEDRIETISKGGLQTEVVDIDYYALERAYPLIVPQLPPEHVDQHVALLHVDTTAMLMNVIHNKQTEYTHRQTYNGEVIANAILKYLDLDVYESSPEKETESEKTAPENKTVNKTMNDEKTMVKKPETSSLKSSDEKKEESKKTPNKPKLSSEALEKIEVKKPSQALKANISETDSSEIKQPEEESKADTSENIAPEKETAKEPEQNEKEGLAEKIISEKENIKKPDQETKIDETTEAEKTASENSPKKEESTTETPENRPPQKEETKKINEENKPVEELTTHRNQLVSRIEKFIQYYYSDASHKKLDFVIISGRCAIIPDLAKSIEEKIGVPTLLANPFIKVKIPKAEKEFIDKTAPIFMLSCGLALRGVT